jgi:hypothetical protein
MYAQLDLEVRCKRPKKKKRPCAPTPQTCAPPTSQACTPYARRRARPPHMGARLPQTCAPRPRRRARHLAGVRALPPHTCVPPSSQACAPYPADVRAPSSQACAPYPCRRARLPHPRARPRADMRALPPQCARPHRCWQNKIYKEGSLISPLHHAWLCVLGLLCGLLA